MAVSGMNQSQKQVDVALRGLEMPTKDGYKAKLKRNRKRPSNKEASSICKAQGKYSADA
ncbi:uncharacterized protein CLUP02_16053 [Colletotrichum lupini]|uniref:Uncharacterized protein n=1 Tax=Colletotrichum lupini TaxID=145971 RepID=A0A9Q8T798_9PEZI|nr:uncharacterized protein CLUP02_16053 [Colletotrichum lupini]UQC90523.1 hypothetical protein CLUP02_16053 [Colletotrichum lupini]